tara:strand:+ start:1759 stop:2184 length:426 start_codon:yes stop_codon:yes gene_type:complete
MPTTGVFNGTNLILKVINDGGSPVATGHTTSATLSLSADMPEATSKDSSGFQEVIAGVMSGEITFEGLVAYDDSAGADEITTYLLGRTKVDWTFSTATTGDTLYSGEGFISSCEVSAEMESPVTYSGTITTTGAITQGSVS